MTVPDISWRRTNIGHLLFAAAGTCIAQKLAVIHGAGFEGVTDAQLAVFRNLDVDGTRLTTLAERAGMTKQGMIELVNKAERQGLVTRSPDADDRRAKIVIETERGELLRKALNRGIEVAERKFVVIVGEDNSTAIRKRLDRGDSIERLLVDEGRRFVHNVLSNVHRRGYCEVTEALLTLFRTLDLDGSRLTDVAAMGRVTKQSMRVFVDRAERMGLVERVLDAVDGRARIIRFTSAGLVMLDDMRRGVAEAEAAFADVHGFAFLHDLKAWLTLYLAAS